MKLQGFFIEIAPSATREKILFFGFKRGQHGSYSRPEDAMRFASFLVRAARMVRKNAMKVGGAVLLIIVMGACSTPKVIAPVKELPGKGCPCYKYEQCECEQETGIYKYSPDGCNKCVCNQFGVCSCTAMGCMKDWRDRE